MQSPVDFKTGRLIFDASLRPIVLENYDLTGQGTLKMKNNGHSVLIVLPSKMSITGLAKRYTATQLHIHWGSKTNPLGSEHTVDGKQYAAELHIVHYNSEKYPNVSMAFDKSDGLAVMGVFIEIGAANPGYENVLSHLSQIKTKSNTKTIPAFDISSLMPKRLDEYFRYDGSLTTPPCYQSVMWTVFKNPVTISQAQYDTLTATLLASPANHVAAVPLVNTFRNPRPIENRVVSTSFKQGVTTYMSAACIPQRKAVIRKLLVGDMDEVIESRLVPRSSVKFLYQGYAKAELKKHTGFPSSVNSAYNRLAKLQEIARPTLAFGSLLRQKSLEIKQSTTSTTTKSLPVALAEAVLPKLNLKGFLACKADLAPATVKFLLSGPPLVGGDGDLFLLDPYLDSYTMHPWLVQREWED
ncbi:carbonic anhydrase 12 isoform X2 [Syngnathoides biaculeatus]|nr:carbonic anhydrase 12 isoform X2 [Syngnathoides biaculeatus]XP_061677522.1 carbonic anhydrase 12 isoform X2 [Syngnathoides biaculeatus]XP_061677523.1 carbonic anhydrase 12 isoform X2 [Syngnathoides biaculeatus]XP_061677524.1 carbonic anhydrase 12 isoform X2 [Syngnathoides biaculeatus]XP_061677525.1 carbonic anhydrase 12 isoform X2 [Syngnathoides biaculeatus]XP_061677526.1 carbonic anhydrase 12 isoform X2 [Syngnathoides biaculeatus]XP_061677527.1 carbonic anhydrase 12 isoform X2 [Syngnathoi